MNWMHELARLSIDDLDRISRLTDLLICAQRREQDVARHMLDAGPEPRSPEEARERLTAVIAFLKHAPA